MHIDYLNGIYFFDILGRSDCDSYKLRNKGKSSTSPQDW